METAEEAERLATGDRAKYCMACNGWVINSNSIKNFAEYDSNAYLRREIVIWGDSVKLRFVLYYDLYISHIHWSCVPIYKRLIAVIIH